jgi:hypothetical protein
MLLLEFGERRIGFLEIVWSLVGEEKKISSAVEEIGPEVIFLDLGREDFEFLHSYEVGTPIEVSSLEAAYLKKLSRYGEVAYPSLHLIELVEVAKARGIPLEPIDLDDDGYLEAFYRDVTARELFVRALQLRWMRTKRLREQDPYEFSMRWNEALFRTRGYNNLMGERVSHMAERIKGERRSPILFVSDPFIGEMVRDMVR